MKKIIKSKIFIVIITTILFTSLGVYATAKYQASEVLYNASNGETMNVEDALNDLYSNVNNNFDNLKIYEVALNNNGDNNCYIIFNISETKYTKIIFEARRGSGIVGQPYIYFSNDLTNWTSENILTGNKYEYIENEFSIPTDTIYVKLEWETMDDRAWFHNIQFK